MKKDQKIKIYIMAGIALLGIAAFIYYILYYTEFFFHSDMAAWLSLASEQRAKKQFFPDNFCYSTGLFIFTAELFILPLMHFISDWVLCREIAVILINIIAFVLIVAFFRYTNEEKKLTAAPFLALILWCLPMAHYEETVYDAAYVTLVIFELCIMMALFKIVSGSCKKIHWVLLALFVFMANLEGIRNLAVIVLPLAAGIVLFLLIENIKDLDRLFSHKRYNFAIFVILAAAASATVCFKFLSGMAGLLASDNGILFAQEAQIASNFSSLITGILRYYSAIGGGGFFSVSGISACINFLVMLACFIIVPVAMLLLYKKIKEPFWKIYILYCWISNLLVLYMMVFMSPFVMRYFYTVFWHNVVLAALLMGYLIERGHKYVSAFFMLSAAAVCITGHGNYILNTGNQAADFYESNQNLGTVTEYLEENGLTYGFASYWNAYKNMALSDGRVKIVSWNVGSDRPNEPFYWLTSKDWYDPAAYPGRCFILLGEGETIDEIYYGLASDIRTFRGYSILIFDKHLYLYEELAGEE